MTKEKPAANDNSIASKLNQDEQKLLGINSALIAYLKDDKIEIVSAFMSKEMLISDIITESYDLVFGGCDFHLAMLESAESQLKQILNGETKILLT